MLGTNNLKFSPEILSRACAVDEFKGLWTGLEQFSSGLNRLGDVKKFGAGFRRVFDPLQEQEITTALIRIAHQPPRRGEQPVSYRTENIQLEILGKNGAVIGALETAPPEQIAPLMEKLVEWLNTALDKRELHPLLTIAMFTSIFLQISPFAEGNIRTARFLVLLLMLKAGYSYAPYAPLDGIMNAKAELIYDSLKHVQDSLESGRPDWSLWLRCFLIVLQEQGDVLHRKLGSEQSETATLPALSARVVNLFEKQDRIQMKEIVRLTNGRRSTLKLRLNELVEEGYLRRSGTARSTWYSRV